MVQLSIVKPLETIVTSKYKKDSCAFMYLILYTVWLTIFYVDQWSNLHYPLSRKLYRGTVSDVWNGEVLGPQTAKGTYPEHFR